MLNCLLVEPNYTSAYPNIALMKLSTWLKKEGKNVEYFKGKKPRSLDGVYDEIFITTLFTYYAEITVDTINYYKRSYPSAKIRVGGVMASMMPEYIEEQTGITPTIGYIKELESLRPDYDLINKGTKWDEYSYVFTSRGCVNECSFCAVPKVEPENWINPDWKNQIDFRRIKVAIQDNNLTAQPIEHFRDVMHFMKKWKLHVVIESGLDCRLFNMNHLKALMGVKFLPRGLRFAFDGMYQDGHIQRTLDMCNGLGGIGKARLMVYVLYNYDDTPLEAEYRMREIIKHNGRPYPQRYTPLDKLTKTPIYVGKYWTEELTKEFRQFYHLPKWFTMRTFPEWLEITEKPELLEDYYRHQWSKP